MLGIVRAIGHSTRPQRPAHRPYGISVAKRTGAPGTLSNMAWIGRQVEPSRQREESSTGLTFSHYREVTALEPSQRPRRPYPVVTLIGARKQAPGFVIHTHMVFVTHGRNNVLGREGQQPVPAPRRLSQRACA